MLATTINIRICCSVGESGRISSLWQGQIFPVSLILCLRSQLTISHSQKLEVRQSNNDDLFALPGMTGDLQRTFIFSLSARTDALQLPRTLGEWCSPNAGDALSYSLWDSLGSFFKDRGYYLWLPRHGGVDAMNPPQDIEVTCNGFALAPLHRGWGLGSQMFELSVISFPGNYSMIICPTLTLMHRTACCAVRAWRMVEM